MIKSLKECSICKKYYDYTNINFCLNLAISEKLIDANKNEKELLIKLHKEIEETTKIKWCHCDSIEKKEFLLKSEELLKKDEKTEREIDELGLDFTNKENIIYYPNNTKVFDTSSFLQFIKKLKNDLLLNTILSFDYLNYDRLLEKNFNPKNYYNNPNFLLIYEFENLSRGDSEVLVKINNIIKQRNSNNKITFIFTINENEKELKDNLITIFYKDDEKKVKEFLNLIKLNFQEKKITIIKDTHTIKINTSNQIMKKNKIKEVKSKILEY